MAENKNMRLGNYDFVSFPQINFDIPSSAVMSELRNCWYTYDVTDFGVLLGFSGAFTSCDCVYLK